MTILEYQIHRYDTRINEFNQKKHQISRSELEKEIKKLNKVIGKQDKLFYICLSILLNLAEDFQIEKKMKKRKILEYLIRMLERNDFNLLIIVLLFLRKMCVVSENKQQMQELDIIKKLDRFFSCNNNILLQLALGLLKNLCFDGDVRKSVVKCSLVPKINDLLRLPNFRFFSIVLIYQISLDRESRKVIAKTDCMKYVTKLIIHYPEQQIGKELIALAINLSVEPMNTSQINEDDLQKLIDRAIDNEDVLVFKVIKNICQSNQQEYVVDCLTVYLQDFIKLAIVQNRNEDLKVELLGLFSSLKIGVNWLDYINNSFYDYLFTNLQIGNVEDDIVLESLNVIANLATNNKLADQLQQRQLFMRIWRIFLEKSEDKEFVYMVLYIIYLCLHHETGIEETILENEEILIRMLEYLTDSNSYIRKIVDEVLNVLKVI